MMTFLKNKINKMKFGLKLKSEIPSTLLTLVSFILLCFCSAEKAAWFPQQDELFNIFFKSLMCLKVKNK